jgi:PAS domain S-box-containing protein
MTADSLPPPLVIIVNDDPVQLRFLTAKLEHGEVRVIGCRSVAEALQAMDRAVPALIITDLYMPDVDGWAFCRMLRSAAFGRFNRTPIIVLSGILAGEEASEIASELGATDFFPLPVDFDKLRARVLELIKNPGQTDRWKVLLVCEADPQVAPLKQIFGQHGCDLHHVPGLAEAGDVLKAGEWEAVICDLDMDAGALAQVGRWVSAEPHTAFVVVTGNPDPTASVASIRAGASAHLRKPYAPEYLFGLCELSRQKNALIRAQRLLEKRTIELRNSDRLLQSILDSSEQVFMVIDGNGNIAMANRAARQITHDVFSARLAPGQATVDTILPEEMRARAHECIAMAMAGRVVHHDVAVKNQAGRERRFMVRYSPLRSADDGPMRVCFNAQDMTRRIEAEEELKLRNHALSSISQGVLITDAQRRITYANKGFAEITGFSLEECAGTACKFTQGPKTDADVLKVIRSRLDAGRSFIGDLINYRKDGEPFWNELSITPVKDAHGRVTQFVGVIRDVTERKRNEEQLRASQGRLQALFDNSMDAIILADDAGHFVDVNPATCDLLGYTREDFFKINLRTIFPATEQAWADGAWREFMREGAQRGECELWCSNGTGVRVDYSAIANIMPGLHLAIIRDATERRTLQNRLLRQQRLESVGRLASGVAHDLNNILTPLMMAPAMLRPHVKETAARMLLDTLETGARRGSAVVQQLLTFSQGESGPKSRVELPRLMADSVTMIRDTFPKNVQVELSCMPGDFPVFGDRNQLQQVILNLAINAADSMPKGGRMVLCLDRAVITPEEAAKDAEAREGEHAVIIVVDHGTGIAPETLDKIFDPFFTTKPFGQGSGLGLSVVMGIVRSHGGFIRTSSRMGVGTIIKVHLPLHRDPAVETPAPAHPERPLPATAGRTVLVVDDESPVRDIIRLTLGREGYHVLCAEGVDAAFTQLQAAGGRVDLVLTDIAMPGVSGVKLIELLRSRRADQAILVMTGNGDGYPGLKDMENHICGLLSKPFDSTTLLRAVSSALGSSPVS